MDHTAHFNNSDQLIHDDVIYTGTDQLGKLCRVLKHGTLTVYRGEKPCLIVDVEKRALKALTENDKGFRLGKYEPFTGLTKLDKQD